jgi:hypothetical protein
MSFKILSKKVLSENHQIFESKHFAVVSKTVIELLLPSVFIPELNPLGTVD